MADVPDRCLDDLTRAIEKLGVHDHLCLIYETQEEQFAAVIPYIKIGLERGEKCIYVVDDNTAAMVINGMKAAGMDVDTAVESGRLAIVTKQDAYLKQGYFDPDWMISFLKRATDEAKAAGFSALWITGEMTWVLSGDTGTERLMEYEAKLNYLIAENDLLALCQYNRNRFSPEIIKGVIDTHPLVIYGGMVSRNFYYVPPDDFLGEEQPAKEIERLLTNIKNREMVEEELQRHQERLEELVKELRDRTKELERRNYELEQMNKAFVGRELKMVELKERIRELEGRLGEGKK
jgi:chemotaxis family two-component system sensor kinase Cph1